MTTDDTNIVWHRVSSKYWDGTGFGADDLCGAAPVTSDKAKEIRFEYGNNVKYCSLTDKKTIGEDTGGQDRKRDARGKGPVDTALAAHIAAAAVDDLRAAIITQTGVNRQVSATLQAIADALETTNANTATTAAALKIAARYCSADCYPLPGE